MTSEIMARDLKPNEQIKLDVDYAVMATIFDNRNFANDEPVVMHSEMVSLPVVGSVEYKIESRRYEDIYGEGAMMRFSIGDTTEGEAVAELVFSANPDSNEFVMQHRVVREDLRGIGIGTTLLAESERFFQALALRHADSVSLAIISRQPGVTNWAKTNNFTVHENSVAQLNDMRDHPERYTIEDLVDIQDGGEIKRGVIIPAEISGTDEEKLNRAVKILLTKKIDPPQ